jgi:hypothetical protein
MFILKRCESEVDRDEEQKVFGGGQQDQTISQDLQPDMFANVQIKDEKVLEIIEVDILTQNVMKRFDVPYLQDDIEIDSKYNDEIVEHGHGYHLFF